MATSAQGDDRAVVHYAAELACSLGAVLIVLAVTAILPARRTTMPGFDLEEQQEEQAIVDRLARENLEELTASLAPRISTESVLTWGAPGPATVQAARENLADLVVVPMRVRDHGLGHALHDHADRYVLHHCDVPVLVIPTTR